MGLVWQCTLQINTDRIMGEKEEKRERQGTENDKNHDTNTLRDKRTVLLLAIISVFLH